MTASRPGPTTSSLAELVEEVEAAGLTLTLYNPTLPEERLALVEHHFDVTTVSVRRSATDDGTPENFAVLHDGDEFISACGVAALSAAVDPAAAFAPAEHPDTEPPALLAEIDQSTFTEYGKRRMILASRDIEKRAWRAGASAIHVGFQEFSRLRTQLDLYRRLSDRLTVHLYGEADWDPPVENVVLHGYATDEIRDHWFVVFEGVDDGDGVGTCAILAQEREPNVYSGFWTSQRPLADRLLDRLEAEYPATAPHT
jgi:hypothetical protein